MVPRRPPCPFRLTAPPGGWCRADPVQVGALTPQQVQHLPAIHIRQELTPPGLHGLRYAALSGMGLYNMGAPLHPYIPYYNRAAVLVCTASGVAVVSGMRWRCYGAVIRSSVAQVVYSRLVWLLYCVRWNRSNQRKRHCKALCAVLQRGRYICIDGRKAVVNVCMGLYCNRTKQKPCTLSRCKAKEKPGHF